MLTVGGQSQVRQEIIRKSLLEVGAVELQRYEHDTRPYHDAEVNLANKAVFFAPCPSSQWIEAREVFPDGHEHEFFA